MFDAIAFAGGGNRCYWQGGFWEAAAEKLDLQPKLIVGVSAGAFAASYSLLGIGPRVRALVIAGCGPQVKNFDPAGWRKGGPLFPVGKLYRDLIAEVLDAPALARLQALTDMQIALSRMPPFVPPLLGAVLGISAYQIEKKLLHPVHPRFGRALGFKQEYAAVRAIRTPAELVDVLLASSGVPPLMPVTKRWRPPGLRRRAGRQCSGRAARAGRARRRAHARAADAALSRHSTGAGPSLRAAVGADPRRSIRRDESRRHPRGL